MLKDARTRIEIRGEGLELAGSGSGRERPSDIARIIGRAQDTVLLLAHDPRRLDEAADLDVPPCCQVTRTEDKSSFRASVPWRGDAFRCWQASAHEATHRCSSAVASGLSTCRSESTARLKWRSLR